MNVIKCIPALIIISLLMACNRSNKPEDQHTSSDKTVEKTDVFTTIDHANWLIGKWNITFPQGVLTEIWKKENDSTYFSHSYFMVGKDTVSSGYASLEKHGKDLFFIQKGRKEKKDVRFTLTASNSNQLVFENAKSTFPQKISYTSQSENEIIQEVSGKVDDNKKSDKFTMKRVE